MCASGEKLLIFHNLSASAGGTDISGRTDNACELGFYLLLGIAHRENEHVSRLAGSCGQQ